MSSKVSTGRVVSGAATSAGGAPGVTQANSGPLFDSASSSPRSEAFTVPPGQSMRLSAFGFTEPLEGSEPQKFTVVKVITATMGMPHAGQCDPCGSGYKAVAAPFMPDLFQEEVRVNGSVWELNYDNNTLIISMPGTYRLIASDVNMLANMYVDRLAFEGDVVVTPLHFGWVS